MKIYRDNVLVRDLTIDENTTILRRLMVENSLNLRVAVAREGALGLKIGDYTDLGSERYVIMDEPTYTLRGGVYDYTVLMRGALHRLEVYTMPDEGRDEWWYYGSVVDHINRVLAALHTKEAGWTVQLPDLTKLPDNSPKNINYANMSILSAFHAICSTESGWGLEFDVLPGQVIRFDREIKNPTAHTFEYGRGLGLYEMTRGALSGEKIATRIIGYGGTANMLNGSRLSFAPINGGFPYIDRNIDLYGLREERVNFDHIYPRRNASITSDAVQVAAGKANWTVADTTLDFNLTDQLIEGAVIMFNTGECVGVEFEIVSYDHTTQTITFKENVDEKGGFNGASYVLPNADRKPKAGDEYILVNIIMPESYTTAAQRELKAATEDYASKKSTPQRSYTVTCDPRVFRVWNYTPFAGDGVRIVDTPNGVDYSTRVIGVEYPVIAPDRVKLTLADKVPIPGAVVMAKSIKEVKTKMAMLDKNQITEERLRQLFHPLGGREGLPFVAEKVTAPTLQSPVFQSGLVRAGYRVMTDQQTGRSTLEIGKIIADELIVDVLTHQKVQAIGGVLILSQAWATITNVVDLGAGCRCFYKPDLGMQYWMVGDQALCKNAGKYYWRLVTSVSNHPTGGGEHWFDLSATTTDGSGIPAEGDEVVLLGHRGGDNTRASATVVSSGTMGYPNPITHYKGVTAFSLAGKERTVIGDDSRFVGRSFIIETPEGDLYEVPRERGAWVTGFTYYKNDRVSHLGSIWLCQTAEGTTTEPATGLEALWLCEVAKGDRGEGWKYPVQLFKWAENEPSKPVGGSAAEWCTSTVRFQVLTNFAGKPLTTADGKFMTAAYPANYRLWGCQGTFDGQTETLIGDWGAVYPISGKDGEKGDKGDKDENGKDTPPELADQKKFEAIEAFFGGPVDRETIETLMKGEGAPFEVKNGIVYMSSAFINKLVVGGLLTADNLVEFKEGLARIGMAELDSAGNMVVKDSGGTVRIRITNGAISSFVEGGSGSVPGFTGGATSSGLYDIGSALTITTVGGDISIIGSFDATARVTNADTGSSGVSATLWLYRGTTRVARVATISARAGGRNADGTPRLYDRQVTNIKFRGFCDKGTYNLKIEQSRTMFGYGSDGVSSASVSGFSWDYSPTTGATTIGSNGFGVIWNKDNLDITEVIDGKLHKTLKAEVIDMPGVLGKARVSSMNTISKQWGVAITGIENSNIGGANKRVYHSAGHNNYSAICTPFGRGSIVEVIDETADSVYLYATGGFNIELIGDNR